MVIAENYTRLRQEIPDHVAIVVAAKKRSADEVAAAIDAGAKYIGENYVQEGQQMRTVLGERARLVSWHMIGHLQKNKINRAIDAFDLVQTVDSVNTAIAIEKRVRQRQKEPLPVLIQINIGSEDTKAGINPREHEPFESYMEQFVLKLAEFAYIRIQGLMTMGPRFGDPERSRPYFRKTRKLFDRLGTLHPASVQMRCLSMGMSNSYKVAIEEGSTMVRIGTALFGPRQHN